MNNERMAREVGGYIAGILAIGAISKSIQYIERRGDRNRKQKETEEKMTWKVKQKSYKKKDGTIETKYVISREITDEELQYWEDFSEEYFANKEGYYIAKEEQTVEKRKVSETIKKAATQTGKAVGGIFVEGVKRRAVYELKDSSRNYAKSAKETEIFLKNNAKNRLRRNKDMF